MLYHIKEGGFGGGFGACALWGTDDAGYAGLGDEKTCGGGV